MPKKTNFIGLLHHEVKGFKVDIKCEINYKKKKKEKKEIGDRRDRDCE